MPDAPAGAADRRDTGDRKHPIEAVPVRHPGRWVAVAVLAVLAAMLVNTVLTNDGFRWQVVGQYLFSEPVLNGLRNTLILTVLSMVIGIVGGVALAVMRLSPNPVLSGVAGVYIWLFRGTPLIAQLLFWNFLAALYPRLSLGIPFGPEFVSFDTNQLINQFTACLLGLGLNEAAYMAEIVRGGLHVGRPGPDRGGRRAGHVPGPDAAPDRAAAGHAGDHPAHRQRDHLDAQDHLAGGRHRRTSSCSRRCSGSTRRTSRRSRCSSWPRSGTWP